VTWARTAESGPESRQRPASAMWAVLGPSPDLAEARELAEHLRRVVTQLGAEAAADLERLLFVLEA
jgi:hypothetical protein